MKKREWLSIAMAMVLTCTCVLMSGCGNSSSTDGNSSSTSENSSLTSENSSSTSESSSSVNEKTVKTSKICVFSHRASGYFADALNAYFEYLHEELNFEYVVRYCGDDAATYYNNVETAIAEGYQGIVSFTDKGNTNEVLALCEENKVYYGGAWNDQVTSRNTSEFGSNFLGNTYYVGNLTDGEADMQQPVAVFCAGVAEAYEALSDDEKEGSIGIGTMPVSWFPSQQIAAHNIYETLTIEYNIPVSAFATNGNQVSVRKEEVSYAGQTFEAGTIQWQSLDGTSRKLSSAYFEENPNLKLYVSTLAYAFIEPTLQTANLHGKVKVWCSGFDREEAFYGNFGDQGDSTYQGTRLAPIEGCIFPLVQMLDKINGYSYDDREEYMAQYYGQTIDGTNTNLSKYVIPTSSSIIIASSEQMDAFLNESLIGTGDGSKSMLDVDEVKTLMKTYNSDATYEKLLSTVGKDGDMTIDRIMELVDK